MIKRIIIIITLISLCLLIYLLNTTTPSEAGPFGILAIFLFAYLSLLGAMTFFLYSISRIISHLSLVFIFKKPSNAISFRHSYYYSTIIASAPILLIALQSVGSNNIYGVLLVCLFIVIGCLYVSKRVQ
ncbi:MAG TPA: hypothetical protein PLO25_02835 [Candidatus Saccharibacteria bacterium]|nr:hypothetical protein [Candidatus Saccharibacteria bacterium]